MNTMQKADEAGFYKSLQNIFSSRIFPYVFFLVIICAVYLRSIMFGVTELDDTSLVILRYDYLKDPYNIINSFFKSVFSESLDTFYRPVLTISWIIDTLIGGGRIWVYHFFDVIYHFTAVCILFNLLKNLDISRNKALVFSSFFAVVPVLNQAVSWIPGRNDTLLAIFILSSFLLTVKYSRSGNVMNAFFAALFFAAALFTKETALAALLIFPAYILLAAKDGSVKKTAVITILLLLCCAIWYSMKSAFTSTKEINLFHIAAFVQAAAIKFFPATMQYISKIFFPVDLKVMPVLSVFDSVAGLLISAVMALLLLRSEKVNRANLLFGILWFVGFLILPYFQRNYFILEHRVYVSMLGMILVLNEIKFKESVKTILPFLLAAYFIFFIAVSFFNNVKFSNELNFATAAMTETPGNVKATFLYGRRSLDNGTYQLGRYFMKKNFEDLTIKEQQSEISNCAYLGLFAWQRGDIAEAKKYLTIAAENNTAIHQTYGALANIYFNEGKYKEALYNIKKAFKLQPANPEYFRYLKLCFMKINNTK